MKALFLAVAVLTACSAFGQDWAKAKVDKSPRHLEWVHLPNGSRTVDAFVAYPEVSHKAPVVIVIHEIFGMSDWVQDTCDQLAAAGYIAIAPDLLSGMGPGGGRTNSFASVGDVREAISNLTETQVVGDLNVAADYGKKLPASSGKLFVVGFCWGGGQSFAFVTKRPDLSGGFVFYGVPPTKAEMAGIHAPVYGFYAGNDMRISATVPDTDRDMKASGKAYEAKIYVGAGHGFMRAGEAPDATSENKAAYEQGWKRLLEILASRSKA